MNGNHERVWVMLPCGHCSGTGRKEAPKLSQTLATLSQVAWLSTQAVAKKLHVGETNMANRLRDLFDLGLAERRGERPHEWRRKL